MKTENVSVINFHQIHTGKKCTLIKRIMYALNPFSISFKRVKIKSTVKASIEQQMKNNYDKDMEKTK